MIHSISHTVIQTVIKKILRKIIWVGTNWNWILNVTFVIQIPAKTKFRSYPLLTLTNAEICLFWQSNYRLLEIYIKYILRHPVNSAERCMKLDYHFQITFFVRWFPGIKSLTLKQHPNIHILFSCTLYIYYWEYYSSTCAAFWNNTVVYLCVLW